MRGNAEPVLLLLLRWCGRFFWIAAKISKVRYVDDVRQKMSRGVRYLAYYNLQRRHSSLNYRIPAAFEQQLLRFN